MNQLTLLVLTALVGSSMSWGGYKVNLDYKNLGFDEDFADIQLQLKKRDGEYVVNIRCEVLQNITDPLVLHIGYFKKVNEDFVHYTNVSLSFCNVFKRGGGLSICPIQKNVYVVTDYVINHNLIPSFIPLPTGSFMLMAKISRVVKGEHIPAVKLTVFADIEKNDNGAKDRPAMKLF